jgi:hypothetical protein
MPRNPQTHPRPRIEEFEPRILYSADLAPLAAAPATLKRRSVDVTGEFTAATRSNSTVATASHELVFVNSDVPACVQLVKDIRAQATDQRRIEVVSLDSNGSGVDQIMRSLGAAPM